MIWLRAIVAKLATVLQEEQDFFLCLIVTFIAFSIVFLCLVILEVLYVEKLFLLDSSVRFLLNFVWSCR